MLLIILRQLVYDGAYLPDENLGSFELEPYALYNRDPEQRVEFFGDASSRLGTIGLAGEYLSSCWEFGFDYAVNLGRQKVKGWDRNQVELQNRNARGNNRKHACFCKCRSIGGKFSI